MLNIDTIQSVCTPPLVRPDSCRTTPEEPTQSYSCRTAPEADTLTLTPPPVTLCAFCEDEITPLTRGGTVYNNLGEAETWCTYCLLDKYGEQQYDLQETDCPEDYRMAWLGEPEW